MRHRRRTSCNADLQSENWKWSQCGPLIRKSVVSAPSRRHRNGHTLLTREDGNSHATLHPEDREFTVHSNQKMEEYCHAGLQPDDKRNSHVLLQPEDTGAVTLCFNQMTRGVVAFYSGRKIQEQPRCSHVLLQPEDTGTVTLCFNQMPEEQSRFCLARRYRSCHAVLQPDAR